MLRRLTLGLFTVACAAAVVACSTQTTTPSSGGVPGVGLNPGPNSIYVMNSSSNDVEIYTPSPGPSTTPMAEIGGLNTQLSGPQYAAFDSNKLLYVTNFNASNHTASVNVYQTYATGNVLPLGVLGNTIGVTQPHGIANIPSGGLAIANTDPGGLYTDEVLITSQFVIGSGAVLQNLIAGSNTRLNNPSGVAIDSNQNVWVTNRGNGSVTAYPLPSPTASPTATPSPTPTPVGATPSPTPTPFGDNVAPTVDIAGAATQMSAPIAVALDASGNVYVADPSAAIGGTAKAAILVFNAGANGNVAPSRVITSSALVNPTDIKVDGGGAIYVIDQGNGVGTSRLLVFAANASGNSTPTVSIGALSGTYTGLALSP